VPSPASLSLPGIARALVVGLGASGRAAAGVLRTADVEVVLVDDRRDPPGADELRASGHRVVLGEAPGDVLAREGADLVVPSPGVPQGAPVLRAAAAAGIPIWSEPELGLRLYPHRLVGVTGTNGKTSTTELIAAMLAADGTPVAACGNIGRPVSEAAHAEPPETVLVAELSSFQLRFIERLHAEVGVLLNLAEDHLDWHGDLAAYGAAKARLWETQTRDDWAVANAEDAATLRLQAGAPGQAATFSADTDVDLGVGRRGDELVLAGPDGQQRALLPLGDLRSRAPHHVANVAAAATCAALIGVDDRAIAGVAAGFSPGRHRLEVVAQAGEVTFVDDSKATNPHAAAAALRSFPSIVWIAGGLAKGVDLGVLRSDLAAVRAAVLIGRAADELAALCAAQSIPASIAASIEDAVALAADQARPGDTVLLAPACASFDQFRDYADRGERFAAAARAVADQPGGDPCHAM